MPRTAYTPHTPKHINCQPCPRCGGPMWIVRIEPGDQPDYDKRTFECAKCGDTEIAVVKYR